MSEISANLLTDKDGGGGSTLMKYPVRGSAKVFVTITWAGGTPTNRKSLNVSSIVDVGTGRLGVNIASSMVDAHYPAAFSSEVSVDNNTSDYIVNYTVGYLEARHIESGTTLTDAFRQTVTVFGDVT